jgi:hypothetical protein
MGGTWPKSQTYKIQQYKKHLDIKFEKSRICLSGKAEVNLFKVKYSEPMPGLT